MKVILQSTVRDLGKKGDVKDVPDGYALNFLIPQRLAVIATDDLVKKVSEEKKNIASREDESQKTALALLKNLSGKTVTISHTHDSHGKLYQGVSETEIINELRKQYAIIIPKNFLAHYKPAKEIGNYEIIASAHGTTVTFELRIA